MHMSYSRKANLPVEAMEVSGEAMYVLGVYTQNVFSLGSNQDYYKALNNLYFY